MSDDTPKARPARKIGRRKPLSAASGEAPPGTVTSAVDRPGEDGHAEFEVKQVDRGDEPGEDKFAELQVSALFAIAALAVVGFIVSYVLIDPHAAIGRDMNFALGGTLAVALLALGAGFILWAKKLLPPHKVIQQRHDFHSPEEEEIAAEDTFLEGFQGMGLGSRKILRRTLLGAAGLLPLPAVLLLRDMGPLPHSRLQHTAWGKNVRLVDVESKQPIKLGDMEIGGIVTVMPDGHTDPNEYALSPTILIRFAPGEIKSDKEAKWGYQDHVAYSKICSHAGCPISLYEQQSHHLLCPCHQSTFDMANDANVIFGPAARRLPQLRITVDSEGYFIAEGDYSQPVGPSFWERG